MQSKLRPVAKSWRRDISSLHLSSCLVSSPSAPLLLSHLNSVCILYTCSSSSSTPVVLTYLLLVPSFLWPHLLFGYITFSSHSLHFQPSCLIISHLIKNRNVCLNAHLTIFLKINKKRKRFHMTAWGICGTTNRVKCDHHAFILQPSIFLTFLSKLGSRPISAVIGCKVGNTLDLSRGQEGSLHSSSSSYHDLN